MTKQQGLHNAETAGKKTYLAPTLTVFGGLRELTLAQLNLPMPADNKGVGEGGKLTSTV